MYVGHIVGGLQTAIGFTDLDYALFGGLLFNCGDAPSASDKNSTQVEVNLYLQTVGDETIDVGGYE